MPLTNRTIIQHFLDYLKFQKRYSQHTVISYENDLISFFDYLLKNDSKKKKRHSAFRHSHRRQSCHSDCVARILAAARDLPNGNARPSDICDCPAHRRLALLKSRSRQSGYQPAVRITRRERSLFYRPARNAPICSLRNFPSSGLGAAPAVCPHKEGIGLNRGQTPWPSG